MSSHRTEEIRALARRVVVLDEGRIVDDRPVAGLPERDPSDLGPGPVRSRRREPDAALDVEAIA
jgi:ABC-type multidrug transport system ATPase subunit